MTIQNYTTKDLQKMRQDLIKCAENEMNVFAFSVADIDEELEYRAQNRIPVCDEQPDYFHTEQNFI